MKKSLFRWLFYLLGMVLLATGLTLNTKTGLGVSAIVGIPYVVSVLWDLPFGDTTLVLYVLFVVLQLLVHWRLYRGEKAVLRKMFLLDVLQLPLSLLFTRLMNGISLWFPDMAAVCPHSIAANLTVRLLLLLLAVVLTGIGAAMTLNMRLVPNPGDGLVQTLAQWRKRPTGSMKNLVDALCVALMLLLGLLFEGRIIGIGLGTVIAAVGIGRVIHLFEKCCKRSLQALAGLGESQLG